MVHARPVLATLDQLEASAASSGEDLLIGYAWAALGEHTVAVQRAWAEHRPGQLVFVQSNTPTAGLLEGRCEVSVVRRPVADPRLESAHIGDEARYAMLATDHLLAHQTTVRLADFVGRIMAIDAETATTTESLWEPGIRPAGFRTTHGIDERLTLIASGRAIGISEATRAQHPRPGIAYRRLENTRPPSPYG
jgi:hypothetical protein